MGSVGWDLGRVVAAAAVAEADLVAVFSGAADLVVSELSEDGLTLGADLASMSYASTLRAPATFVPSDPGGALAGAALVTDTEVFDLDAGVRRPWLAQTCGSSSYISPIMYGGDGFIYHVEVEDAGVDHECPDGGPVTFYLYRAPLDRSSYTLVSTLVWPQGSWPTDAGSPPGYVDHLQWNPRRGVFFASGTIHAVGLMTYWKSSGAGHLAAERMVWASMPTDGSAGSVSYAEPTSLNQIQGQTVRGLHCHLGRRDIGSPDPGTDGLYHYPVGADRSLVWSPPSVSFKLNCCQRFGSTVYMTDRPDSMTPGTDYATRLVIGSLSSHTSTTALPTHATLGVRPAAVLLKTQSEAA